MKYMGSKARIARELYNRICAVTPREGRPWVEPFAGGMNMICNVPASDGPRFANDVNPYLIAMFKALVSGWVPPKNITKDFYEQCRNLDAEDYMIGYVGFNASYSGKWFGGYAGKVNTAIGTVRDYQLEAFNHMQKQIETIKDVWFLSLSYEKIIIPENSIVYCDPPYSGTTGYKVDFNHEIFWDWVRSISFSHDVFVSEYNAPIDFEVVWEKKLNSSLSANGKSGANKQSVEKLFKLKR